jgi:hypothetical protein
MSARDRKERKIMGKMNDKIPVKTDEADTSLYSFISMV